MEKHPNIFKIETILYRIKRAKYDRPQDDEDDESNDIFLKKKSHYDFDDAEKKYQKSRVVSLWILFYFSCFRKKWMYFKIKLWRIGKLKYQRL